MQEGIIDRGGTCDFGYWYLSLVSKNTTYEHVHTQCGDIEDPFVGIHSKILIAIKELPDLDFDASSELDSEKLVERLESLYFTGMDSFEPESLEWLSLPHAPY